jgi:hypothetical protein
MDCSVYNSQIESHYRSVWKAHGVPLKLPSGPWSEVAPCFCVLEFEPTPQRSLWTYATAGMSAYAQSGLELHMHSDERDTTLAELLTATAHYHVTGQRLNLGHSVNFGRPWRHGSHCSHALVSLPYLDGPELEYFRSETGAQARCLWLIPITQEEVAFKRIHGIEELERVFDKVEVRYAHPGRNSVV